MMITLSSWPRDHLIKKRKRKSLVMTGLISLPVLGISPLFTRHTDNSFSLTLLSFSLVFPNDLVTLKCTCKVKMARNRVGPFIISYFFLLVLFVVCVKSRYFSFDLLRPLIIVGLETHSDVFNAERLEEENVKKEETTIFCRFADAYFSITSMEVVCCCSE